MNERGGLHLDDETRDDETRVGRRVEADRAERSDLPGVEGGECEAATGDNESEESGITAWRAMFKHTGWQATPVHARGPWCGARR